MKTDPDRLDPGLPTAAQARALDPDDPENMTAPPPRINSEVTAVVDSIKAVVRNTDVIAGTAVSQRAASVRAAIDDRLDLIASGQVSVSFGDLQTAHPSRLGFTEQDASGMVHITLDNSLLNGATVGRHNAAETLVHELTHAEEYLADRTLSAAARLVNSVPFDPAGSSIDAATTDSVLAALGRVILMEQRAESVAGLFKRLEEAIPNIGNPGYGQPPVETATRTWATGFQMFTGSSSNLLDLQKPWAAYRRSLP